MLNDLRWYRNRLRSLVINRLDVMRISFEEFRRHHAVSVAHFGRIIERIHGECGVVRVVEGRGEGQPVGGEFYRHLI